MFSKVIFDDTIQGDIARVNRQDRTLYLNPSIWNRLNGLEREFVLLHEAGHLELMTADEFAANKYAIEKFVQVEALTDAELGKRIVVISEITDPENYVSGNFIGDIVGQVNNTLSILGVGSKKRRKEAEAAAKAAKELESAKSASNIKLLVIGGFFVVVIIVLFFTFK
jgi:hypothetical protein